MPANPTSSPSEKACYALLVGINTYQGNVAPLYGCENDVHAVEKWLHAELPKRGYDGKNLHIKKLLTADAVKEQVTLGFLDHLTQAKEGDLAFFYYSGHGAQEVSHEYFRRTEADDELETIVMHDSRARDENGKPLGTDMSDKELRYLLRQVSKNSPKLVAVFDCCHAGGNVRGIEEEKEKKKGGPRARLSEKVKARDWDHFLFAPAYVTELKKMLSQKEVAKSLESIDGEQLRKHNLDELIPPPDVIQLAACRADESAQEDYTWEDEDEYGGVFTYTLLNVLNRSDGGVSYYDLNHRVRRYIRGQKAQTPQMYASGAAGLWMFEGFLGGEADGKGLYGIVQRDEHNQKWVMNLGAIHGIPPTHEAKNLKLRIEDQAGKVLGTTSISLVEAEYCEVEAADFLPKPKREDKLAAAYKGFLENFFSAPVNISLVELDDSGKPLKKAGEGLKLFQQELKKASLDNLHIVDDPAQAQYQVVARDKEEDYIIARAQDGDFRPIVREEHGKARKSIQGFQARAAETLVSTYLPQIARWEFVKELENTQPKLFKSKPPITVSFFELETEYDDANRKRNINGEKAVRLNAKGEPMLDCVPPESRDHPLGFFKISLKNETDQVLNVAPLIMHIDFSISGIAGQESLISIPGGKSHDMLLGFDFRKPEHKVAYPTPYVEAYLKLMVATRNIEFDVEKFKLEALPPPAQGPHRDSSSLSFNTAPPALDDWTTQLVRFYLKNVYVKA